MPEFPNLYKKFIEIDISGVHVAIAGSSQPGIGVNGIHDSKYLLALQEGQAIEKIGIDEKLICNLESLYEDGIRNIYCLIQGKGFRNTDLIKNLWQTMYEDTKYITEINGTSLAIEDLQAPAVEQLDLVCDHVMSCNEGILIHCNAGMGRTGTILSALYMKYNKIHDAGAAIGYIRENYHECAVETDTQRNSLSIYAEHLKKEMTIENVSTASSLEDRQKIYISAGSEDTGFVHQLMKSRSAGDLNYSHGKKVKRRSLSMSYLDMIQDKGRSSGEGFPSF
jgi:hypothetical protein